VFRVVCHGVLWHRPESFRRSVAYALVVVVASVAVVRSAWSVDGTSLADGHAIVSLDLAIARAFCGIPSSFSRTVRIPMDVSARMELRHVPLRTLIEEKAGSIDAYCRSVDQPFANSENSLMLLETATLRVMPGVSLAQLGQVLHLVKIACIAGFVLLLMDLGSSLAFGLGTMLCGLMLLQAMSDHAYSNYPFLFALILLAVAVHGFAIKYRWTDRTAGPLFYGAVAGLLSAFIANLRTSYLPIVGLFFALVLVDAMRPRGRTAHWRRRTLRGLALAGCFLMAYGAFQVGLITRHLPPEGRFNAAHPFGHPLVLALAVPENAFSRAMGIRWADEVGPQIAERVDPGVPFLGPRYNAALLYYYATLWRTHTREMFAVYVLKFAVSGSDMIRVLRTSPGLVGWGVSVLLTPLALLPNGLWILGLYAAITFGSFALYYRRDLPAAFALALLSLAACLVQVESGLIFSIFVKQYHNYAAFYALFLSLLGVQGLANAAWVLAARVRPAWAVPE
jgi:hypothetical protein